LKWKSQNAVGGHIAIGSDDSIYCGDSVFNPDGTLKWKYSIWMAFPSIGDNGTIYSASGSVVDAVSPNGNIQWGFNLEGYGTFTPPAIGSDGTIYFGSTLATDVTLGYVYAINPNGTLKWKSQINNSGFSSPTIGPDGTIYIISSGPNSSFLYAFNSNGIMKWSRFVDCSNSKSTSIGADGTIYLLLYYALIAINPDGSEKWRYTVNDYTASSLTISPNGVIYFGSNDGNLYAINATCGGPASSPWPMMDHDAMHTGRYSYISPPAIPYLLFNPISSQQTVGTPFQINNRPQSRRQRGYRFQCASDSFLSSGAAG
jgi:outer membrane protein assembly factor BamB